MQPPALPGNPAGAQPAAPPVAPVPADAKPSLEEITVRDGETLYSVAARHGGTVNASVLDCILESNPEITDMDRVQAGSRILVPRDAGKARVVTLPDGSFSIHVATFVTHREARDYATKIGS